MNQLKLRCLGLLVLQFAVNLSAQPVLVHPQNQPFGGTSINNLRVRSQSADGTETILTVDFSYDGINGSSVRLVPIITDKKRPKISGWFGANPVSVSTGRGTVSLRVKFFNDEPGVPAELTTDHVNVLMLTDGGYTMVSQGRFARTIKWGGPNAKSASATAVQKPVQNPSAAEPEAKEQARRQAEAKLLAEQQAEARRIADEKMRQEAEAKRLADQQAEAKRVADEKARQAAEAKQLAEQQAEARRIADEKARQEAEAKRLAEQQAEAKRIADEKAKAREEAQRLAGIQAKAAAPVIQPLPATPAFVLSSKTKTRVTDVDIVSRNMDRTEMTIAVQYQYAKEDGLPKMGVDISSTEDPEVSAFFSSPLMELGHRNRSLVMFPIKLEPAASQSFKRASLPTDKVWIYLADANGTKSYIYQGTMVLLWHLKDH